MAKRTIKISNYVGTFAENKDIARDIRKDKIEPLLAAGDTVILDFTNIDGATQSFIHALISDVIRAYTGDILDRLLFQGCNDAVQGIINIVADYMQQVD